MSSCISNVVRLEIRFRGKEMLESMKTSSVGKTLRKALCECHVGQNDGFMVRNGYCDAGMMTSMDWSSPLYSDYFSMIVVDVIIDDSPWGPAVYFVVE